VFLMDTAETTTERLLAQLVLDRHPDPRQVLVGGLGLGCTLGALLDDPRVARVVVVEIEPLLVRWLQEGCVPGVDRSLADSRVRVEIGDVRDLVAGEGRIYDAVVLDVDNGPGFLVHERNAGIYEALGMASVASALRPGGLLVVWSADRAPLLQRVLEHAVGPTEQVWRRVRRQGRDLDYYLYVAHKQREAL
jgi:spermidine synthase